MAAGERGGIAAWLCQKWRDRGVNEPLHRRRPGATAAPVAV